jgi:hypothetical protein
MHMRLGARLFPPGGTEAVEPERGRMLVLWFTREGGSTVGTTSL